MIRRAAIYMLAASLIAATSPAFACTGISLKSEDGAALRGRTLEFGYPINSSIIVVPAGQEVTATRPDGSAGLSYKTRYDIVGANAVNQPVVVDGLNDQGLSVGLFYFAGFAEYAKATKENASRSLAPQDFGLWVLGNFATVDEVKRAVKDITMVPTPLPGLGSAKGIVAPVHFFVQDKTGQSIAIEPVDGELRVMDAPLGVMTNGPTYDWQMTNLKNYVNLTPKDVSSEKLGPVTIKATGAGSGLLGIPGDFTPPSRFVRAAIFSQAAVRNATAKDGIFTGFHILNQFDIPVGAVIEDVGGRPTPEITEWTVFSDLKNLRFYFRTFEDQSIRMVDLKEAIAAAKGKIGTIPMEITHQTAKNVSKDVTSLKQGAN